MACVWGAWWHIPAAFIMTIAGILGHELVHLAAMKPISQRTKLHISNIWMADLHVESEIRNEEWRHTWADVAGILPILTTVLLLAALWGTGNLPDSSTVLGFGFYHMMAWYGVLGGLTDYSRSESTSTNADDASASKPPLVTAMSDGGQEFIEREQRLLNTVLMGLLSGAIGILYYGYCSGLVSTTGVTLASLGILLSVSATGVLLRRAYDSDLEFDWKEVDDL